MKQAMYHYKIQLADIRSVYALSMNMNRSQTLLTDQQSVCGFIKKGEVREFLKEVESIVEIDGFSVVDSDDYFKMTDKLA